MTKEKKTFTIEGSIDRLTEIRKKYEGETGTTIPVLQDIQEAFGYLPEDAVNWFADSFGVPRSRFFGVATFYAQFHLKPRGRNIVTACSGTACHVKGSDRLINSLRRELKLNEGEDTTGDMEFTLEKVNCVGACSIAPVVIINKKVYGKAQSDRIAREIKAIRKSAGVETEEDEE